MNRPAGQPDTARGWLLLYDGQCAFCRRCVGIVRRWDRRGRVAVAPFQDAATWEGMPGLSRDALERAIHLVSPAGRIYGGAAAAPPLLRLLPGGRSLAAPLALPVVSHIAAAAYRWMARNRHQLGCASPTCHRGD